MKCDEGTCLIASGIETILKLNHVRVVEELHDLKFTVLNWITISKKNSEANEQ